MILSVDRLAAAVDKVAERIGLADRSFDQFIESNDEWAEGNSKWHIEIAFTQLLVLAEALNLPALRSNISRSYEVSRKTGLLAAESSPDGLPHLKSATVARRYLMSLQDSFVAEPNGTITKALESILRDSTYSITNPSVYSLTPTSESTVHDSCGKRPSMYLSRLSSEAAARQANQKLRAGYRAALSQNANRIQVHFESKSGSGNRGSSPCGYERFCLP